MTVAEMYLASLEFARAATPEQLDAAADWQYEYNVFYLVDRHLESIIPECPAESRRGASAEIAPTCNGEGIVAACRRWASGSIREQIKREFDQTRLGDRHKRNDTGNGERFAADHADSFRFLDDRKVWMRWDGQRWRDATDGELMRAAKKTAKKMLDDAGEDKEDNAWALATLSRRGLNNMIACAQSDKLFRAKMSDFDQNLDLINVQNGTLDLRTGYLYPHMREDMLTTLTDIKYEPTADCARWQKYLREIFADDEDLIEFIQRAVGYSLTGHTREHAFFVLWGGGKNGKGRFIRQLMALLGDAARTTGFKTFTANRDDAGGNTPALATLAGARLVSAGEPDEGVRFSESVIKSLTGEDEIQVCQKYERPFTFLPRFKIWLHVNHKPGIRGTDEGIWRRPRLIPFTVSFMGAEEAKAKNVTGVRRDPDLVLDDKLDAERVGILAWAVRGARTWYRIGLRSCKSVDDATSDYRGESDRLKPFIDECVKDDPGKFVTNDRLCEAYSSWCKRNLIQHEMNGQTLSKQMAAKGYLRGKDGKDQRGFKDISLVTPGGLMGMN